MNADGRRGFIAGDTYLLHSPFAAGKHFNPDPAALNAFTDLRYVA
jgi:hypothetical protein